MFQMMNSSSIFASLLDLQLQTDSTLEQVTWVMSASSLGILAGGLLLGKHPVLLRF